MNQGQNQNQQYYAAPEYVSGNPVIDNVKKAGQSPLFLIASAIYIALPILQLILNGGGLPIQLIGVVGMILIVVTCNAKAYPGVKTAGFTVLKAYSIVMIVLGGLLAVSSGILLAGYDSFMRDETFAESINELLAELEPIVGEDIGAEMIFAVLLIAAAVVILRYVFVLVMCVRINKTLHTGKNCGKIPVILAVFYIITTVFNVIGLFGTIGGANFFGYIVTLLDVVSGISFALVIFRYNNSLSSLWYS